MLNRIILIGRLVRDPELRFTPSGKAVCQFTLAVDRQYADQNGERQADFINIVVWGKAGESCAQYLAKGRLAEAKATCKKCGAPIRWAKDGTVGVRQHRGQCENDMLSLPENVNLLLLLRLPVV